MKLRIITILLVLFYPCVCLLAQGLLIKGNDSFIEQRTSYNVFHTTEPVFNHRLSIEFELAPVSTDEVYRIGYLLRLKNKEAGTTFNILYNDQGGATVFKLNHEGKDVLITAVMDKWKLYENYWIKMRIDFDMDNDSVHFTINDRKFSSNGLVMDNSWKPSLFFGKSEHVIDVPSFALRNLVVGNADKVYRFPLNESSGEEVHDSDGRVTGRVINPAWLINKAYYWEEGASFSSRSVAGSNFNPHTQEVYYFNKDSITIHNIRTKQTKQYAYSNECPIVMRLGTNFIDWENKLLYVYEVSDPPGGDVMIATLSLDNYEWSVKSTEQLPRQLHHHCSFTDEANRRHIIFGGFGNLHYSDNFYSYSLEENHWDKLNFERNPVTPRYFASMGNAGDTGILYLFGGMGNESGDQTVGRVYYYQLFKVDLNEGQITKLWEIPWKNENVVPVRGMIVDGEDSFYTLCYPEHFSHSQLKLYKFSIADGSYEILGDSIPILSEKIKTHANLYYNKRSNELISIVQEFDYDDIASTAKIYSLSFPPVTKEGLTLYSSKSFSLWLWVVIGVAFIMIQVIIVANMLQRKRKQTTQKATLGSDSPLTHKPLKDTISPRENLPNSIYLFGGFSMIDRNNREINYMLSAKLKQAFFLILRYSLENGITSQEFSELLWPDKPEDKVKNSRGVTLNNLRKILSGIDGVNLVHERGVYKIVITDECYCDYVRCLEIASDSNVEEHIEEFAEIISRGKFLKSVDVPLLDSFKEYIERRIEPIMFLGMEKAYASDYYNLTISLCEGIFNCDPLNEESLSYLIQSLMKLKQKDEAKRRYLLFTVEYKKTMGEEYGKSFAVLSE